MDLPSREFVLMKIRSLQSLTLSREAVSDWACSYICSDSAVVVDYDVWAVLQLLGAADLPCSDGGYLYEDVDFADWAEALSGRNSLWR